MDPGRIRSNDGVSVLDCGDVFIALWTLPSRVHRVRWLFDQAEAHAAQNPGGIVAVILILPSSTPPDGAARGENALRLAQMKNVIRRVVTVPLGDALWMSIVRTVMRAMFMAQGTVHTQVVASSVDDGIERALEVGSVRTPSAEDLREAIAAILEAAAT